jgi:hypothetical protein
MPDPYGQVSRAPTQPRPPSVSERFDEKLRQAYFWIVNHAIICPYYDLEFNDGPQLRSPLATSSRGCFSRLARPTPASSCCPCCISRSRFPNLVERVVSAHRSWLETPSLTRGSESVFGGSLDELWLD